MMITRLLFTAFIALIFLPLKAFPQKENANEVVLASGDTIQIQALILSDISSKIEEISLSLSKIDGRISDDSDLQKTDSIISQKKLFLQNKQKLTIENINELSTRNIEDRITKWKSYIKELKTYQKSLTAKTKELENDNEFLLISTKTWELTHHSIKEQNGPQETLARINEEIKEISNYSKKIRKKLNQISKVQNDITDLILLSDKVISQLTTEQLNWQSEYLRQNSPVIWAKSDTIVADTNVQVQRVSITLKENSKSIKEYFSDTINKLYLQFAVFILLIFIFYFANRKLQNIDIPAEDKRMQKVRFFVKHYISSAWIFAIIISIWLHPERPRPVNELLIFLLVIPSIFLYYRILSSRLKYLMIPVIILFLLGEFQLFIEIDESYSRFLLLIESLVPLWLFYMIIRERRSTHNELQGKWWNFVSRAAYVFLVLSLISFFANIFGFTNLALLCSEVVSFSILFGIMLSLVVGIVMSLLIMFFQSKLLKELNLVKNHQQLIEKRISFFLQFYALFLWLRAIVTALGGRSSISNWFSAIMDSSLKIGSSSISFGGIINFFIVIIAASIFSKILKGLLEEEIFPRIELPRGVPGAISMVVRYFIIGWGIYIALESTGMEMSKLGLLAGALGVGIGFGLQNIVANFISGLILAFERPIQAGDTIEVGTLMGDVKEIGVRASIIKTFDGSEVIVPNSNLVSHEVVNWTLSDRKRRRDIPVSVAYGSDPREVLAIIKKIAGDHPSVIKNPGPWATFEGFGESSLNFKIRFWVSFDIGLTIKSEVAMNIYDAFEEAGIHIPFPQQDLHIKSFESNFEEKLIAKPKKKSRKKDSDVED